MAAGHDADIFHHVRDVPYFELPFGHKIELPSFLGFQFTKFMVLQLIAGLFVLLVFRGLAKRVASGRPVRGWWWNAWEGMALYIRDNVVRPSIGIPHEHDDDHAHATAGGGPADHVGDHHGVTEIGLAVPGQLVPAFAGHGAPATAFAYAHPADRYLPFVWTIFFYVLICNLLGAFPWMGSATGEINVTAALALITAIAVIIFGSQRSGAGGFWLSLAPKMDLPGPMKYVLVPMIWVIEFAGFIIKHAVLAIRLFANIMGGHTVVAVILGFIAVAAHSVEANAAGPWLYYSVLSTSILGQVAIGLLELLVAFLQAYIFAFLASVFISMAVNPH